MPKNLSDKMKQMKLIVHQKNFSEEELIINQKDFPDVRKGDLLEIYDPNVDFSHLLLQVTCIKDDNVSQKDSTISIEQSVASTFNLRTYEMVIVNVVDRSSVALDSLEVTFKDQYLGRSDMWRLKKNLIGTCVYMNKKIEFCHKTVRCQVYEMWGQGEKVACGVVVEDTKIVFRSSTSLVYLFIQMSSEMWDFDIYGDLYFEKAVNGFLTDLFTKWKKENSNHEVTIVLFSRVFYKANALEDFPESMRSCLQKDYRGRFCEDFYRVAVQSERYDDWASILFQLRRLFNEWNKIVLEYHQRPGISSPRGVNSTAAQGNFLEVLNMSLNVFEKHYLDRSFDRTGQLSVVITPGVGVYEVDRELTNLTKQRIIDNGVGSDLVCVGEQPLHAVPLLKFHNKHSSLSTANDFSMPHWINLSFYSSSKKVGYSTFVPRIKLPPPRIKPAKSRPSLPHPKPKANEPNNLPNSLFDYDAYDSQVFALPASHSARNTQTQPRSTPSANRTRKVALDDNNITRSKPTRISRTMEKETQLTIPNAEILSTSLGVVPVRTPAVTIPPKLVEESLLSISMSMAPPSSKPRHPSGKDDKEDDDKDPPLRPIIGSADDKDKAHYKKNAIRTGRALINPFDPSHVTIKLTSNRRRWTHIFPKGPTGVLIQQHHYQAIPASRANYDDSSNSASTMAWTLTNVDVPRPTQFIPRHRTSTVSSVSGFWDNSNTMTHNNKNRNRTLSKTLTLLWGATGEQEWTPALTTGVDWKSLTIPACLPITTDYFPDKRSLQNDYVVSDYSLLPDDVNADYVSQRGVGRRHLTTLEVFHELISQRLAQGFQLIVKDKDKPGFYNAQTLTTPTSPAPSSLRSRLQSCSPSEEYFLSIGRIFHKIGLQNSTITVTGYRPRHPYPTQEIHYRYRLQTPDQSTYGVTWVDFNAEKLENYNWNYLDHYICTRGDRDFSLTESLKYWRLRLCLLPCAQRAARQAEENYADRFYPYDENHYVENVLKFLETCVNKDKLRKPPIAKKARVSLTSASALRERGGSNRVSERPRSRLVDRLRSEVSNVRVSSVDSASSGFADGRSSSLGSLTTEGSDLSSESEGLSSVESKRIRAGASLEEVVDLMKNTIGGLTFLAVTKFNLLPSYSFLGTDASAWLIEHMEGVNNEKDAKTVLQKMVDEGLICHASGYTKHPFVNGLYLYFICNVDKVPTKGEADFPSVPINDLESFQYEYVECEVKEMGLEFPKAIYLEPNHQRFMEYALHCKNRYDSLMNYKSCNLDMDANNKSDRVEWGHLKYQATVLPDAGFEIIIQWMACTGALVADMVQNWVRKATACGLQLVHMPCDPFALPLSHKADPLRSPIFVPLNLEGLGPSGKGFLEDFPAVSWAQRLFFFQESIVRHFGFVPCNPDPASPFFSNQLSSSLSASHSAKQATQDRQFMHVCGAIFVLILSSVYAPDNPTPPSSALKSLKNESGFDVKDSRGYITRHVVGKRKWEQNKDIRVGFLWSWNTMVGKKIRTNLAGEEIRLLAEFRQFCANENNVLRKFLESSERS